MTLKDTIEKYAHMDSVLGDPQAYELGFAYATAYDLWHAVKAGQAEIDGLRERNAFLLTSAETAQAKLAECRAEVERLDRIVRLQQLAMKNPGIPPA